MLNLAQLELQRRGRERGIGERVLARIIRLNPDYQPSQRLRGWHPAPTLADAAFHNWVSRGQFIRGYGREAWDKLPRSEIRKDGRRQRVTREAVEDCLWMVA